MCRCRFGHIRIRRGGAERSKLSSRFPLDRSIVILVPRVRAVKAVNCARPYLEVVEDSRGVMRKLR